MVLFIFCFGGGVLVVVGVLWWFSSNSFEILYGSLWIEVLFFGFAGFPASLDGLANATAMVLSSSLWFLGWLWISVVSWSLELRITNILRHPPSTVGAWVWYLMLLKVDFVFFYFFCYQWDTTSRGGVLSKLNRWRFQLLLTTVSSCGGCFDWYVVEVYTLVCTPPTRGFLWG